MTARVAILSDIHGNAAAFDAVRKAIRREKPDAVIVAGDLVLNGPDPAGAVDGVRELEAEGAIVVQGNTDVAVGDFDYSAAFPWMTDGVPDTFRAAAEWAHEELGDERLAWLRRLPSERRLRLEETMFLACHASPGSQTQGHTHLPEVRDLGWKIIVNDGSAGYVFDGDPTASWALVTVDGESVSAEIRRTEFDTMAVSNAISARGLPGDVYRAATVRTGKLVR
jgi:predicted phosphodiesterase